MKTALRTEQQPLAKPRRSTCTDHCGGCNEHFHGLSAFEAHRQNGQCVLPLSALASKGKNAGSPLLQVWTDDGWCVLQTGCKRDGKVVNALNPVTIYQRVGSGYAGPQQEALL